MSHQWRLSLYMVFLQMSYNIRERGTSYCLLRPRADHRTSLETISNVPWHIPAREAYLKVAPPSETFIRGASPGVSDELWDKNAICGWRWDVATQERKICNMEIEIVTLVVKKSAKLTDPTDWQEQIRVRSRSFAFRRVFDLKFRGIHLTEMILKVWVINGQYVINVSICKIELRCYFSND